MNATVQSMSSGASAGPLPRDGYDRVLRQIDLIFTGYMALLGAMALAAWVGGKAGPSAFLVFAGFYFANAAFSLYSRRSAHRVRIARLRMLAGALIAPAAYLLAGDPFMRWWPAFLILCLSGTVLLGLHGGSARIAKLLVAYCVALYAGAEALAPPPHDWTMLLMNAGAIVFVALLFGQIVAFLAAALAAERERRAELAAEKARSEAMLQTQAAQALQERETQFRSLIQNGSDIITVVDSEGRFQYVSPAFERVLGYAPDDVVGTPFLPLIHPEDAAGLQEKIALAMRNPGLALTHQFRVRHKNGSWRTVESYGRSEPGDGVLITNTRDVSDRTEAEEALRRLNAELERRVAERTADLARSLAEQGRLAAIIEATSDYVGIADLDGRSVYVNRAGRELVGLDASSSKQGESIADCYPPRVAGKVRDMVETALRGEVWSGEIEMLHADGHEIPVSEVTFLLRDASGRPEYVATIIRDISAQKRTERELKRAEVELRKAKDAAEAANRAKSTFLATMSHEIRTPMNAVIGMTSLLLETPLNARQRDFVETVRASGDALLTVINDILDFSKIEAEKLELLPRPFALRDSVEAVLDLLAPRAAEKGLELALLVEEGVPPAVVGDVTRLRQILVNLVGNAIKFTERGEVIVTVAPGAAPGMLAFSVRDTGPGIASARRHQLFQSFSQLDSSATREHGGTGLGLAISRRLAELMGGRMWVESDGVAGRGATFHFTIAAEPSVVPAAARTRAGALPELRGKRVLIVDDNATNRRILALQARGWGMQPVLAADAGEALACVRSGEPLDLAVLDVHLPVPEGAPTAPADGVALAREICRLRGAARLPLVMLTSVGGATLPEAGTIQCFEAWLTKPVKPSHLYDALVGALVPGAAPAPGTAEPAAADAPLADRLPLRILLVEDVALNQKFALLALERMGYRADVAGNGLEALAALGRQPYDVIFMDVQMPVLDGLEATRRIRAGAAALAQPYIIAMTANAMQGDREACLEAGMDDYVSKPVYLSELRAALERAALGRGCREPVRAEMVSELRARRGGGALIETYLEDAARLGEALREAFDRGAAAALAQAAHALKGVSGYVGAERLVALCARLEASGRGGSLVDAAAIVEETERELARVRAALAQPVAV
jgi:PAS domain S-box-containing protein